MELILIPVFANANLSEDTVLGVQALWVHQYNFLANIGLIFCFVKTQIFCRYSGGTQSTNHTPLAEQ